MLVLVINSGSSSLKYQVRETDTQELLTKGIIDRIGDVVPDHAAALEELSRRLRDELDGRPVDAVGHRVVHGGERFSEPVLVNNEIVRSIERLSPLAPLHNPASAMGIRAVHDKWPDIPQVAVFDTAFHRTLPERAWRYALPNSLYRRYGIRRYGFHGTSYAYVAPAAARFLGLEPGAFDGVIAHLGNGASVAAIKGGKSIDTSMGFTPLEGLVMGTRSGDIDPSILVFLARQGYDADALDDLLNRESGLRALAGESDMRSIEEAAGNGNEQARLALAIAAYRLAKYIGAYHVAVGGAQAVVFTAGIGENGWMFRELVVNQLGPLGIRLDPEANRAAGKEARRISSADSAISVLVVPTDEEEAIAEATAAVVARSKDAAESF
ncbi:MULTISPECIES: acetate kinase [unclassified Arthrobacter]|uniref:acetate/propionate family kinase n=1 Tax=unclassified Arthrobacter TaxID=235627 RepID=UPI001E504AD1|nr:MULTISPECIES: acetate kinase [unclassified Arthrobacter]MCC9144131.1 acetate kinase [Arthrobacter sp. zg-Y919]MDK1275356.1 acetate kinase [Arthrobacter sp. zg.Y919]MDM7990988.1 acetate kinase [Arthrobacter sp. zg-Y877]WIB03256.1 acetate kinase [Arthrobacter sp. zg-Y919]